MAKLVKKYSDNMGQLKDYSLSLPTKKKNEGLTEKQFLVKYEFAKKYFIDRIGHFEKKDLIRKYGLTGIEANRMFLMLKEYEKGIIDSFKKDNNIEKIKKEITLEERLENIRLSYGSEILIKGEQSSIEEGFVYMIENPAFPGWIKVGMAIDYETRLSSYNTTYDPLGRFCFIKILWTKNRKDSEKDLLSIFREKSSLNKGEWFKIEKSVALTLFNV